MLERGLESCRGVAAPSAPVRDLLGWLEAPSSYGLSFARDDGGWDRLTYAGLAGLVGSAAAWIAAERPAGPNPIAIVLPTGPEFPTAFYGTLVAGATPCPLAPPPRLGRPDAYVEHLAGLLRTAEPGLIVTDAPSHPAVADAAERAGIAARPLVLPGLEPVTGWQRRPPAELALLQFTSGSSGQPRGARVSWENLTSNVELGRRWTRPRPDDLGVTFLPLHHDMGLIGTLMLGASIGAEVRVMRPEQFVARPERWLSCFGHDGATAAGGPTFGFSYVRRRVPDEALEGMRFERWRLAVVGAERVDAGTLSEFAAWLEPYGLRRSIFAPAYGLAEATLAVTGGRIDEPAPCVRADWAALRDGAPVPVREVAPISDRARVGDGSEWLVSSGRPHPGVDVRVLDEEARELSDGSLGELFVTSPSIVQGYAGGEESGHTRFARGGLMTGDAGFKLDGELYVCGRLGDSINVNGRRIYAEDLEARAARLPGLGLGSCVVLAGSTGDSDHVVLLAQARPGLWIEAAVPALRALVGRDPRIDVLVVPRKTIMRTSSGKPRRRPMWQAFLDGRYAAFAAVSSRPR